MTSKPKNAATAPPADPEDLVGPAGGEELVAPPVVAESDLAADEEYDAGNDYVTFEMHGAMYAFPMERVQEIIRMPRLVRLPLGPPALDGLANLRGRVLPVVSLRSCCGLPAADHGEATRVVIVEAGGATLGFVVDRVAAVTSVEPGQVEAAESVQSTVRSDVLAGVIKNAGDQDMTTVLDVAELVDSEFAVLARQFAGKESNSASGLDRMSEPVEDEDSSDTLELVSFAVDGQEYALPIDRVREIVQAPESITAVPNSPDRTLGVMDLRGQLLPVVSLRRVFGLPAAALEPHNRIVVVSLDESAEGSLVGVVMDTVREVLRVPLDLVGALPGVIAGGRRTEVESVCRLDSGNRLVSVLSAEAMFDLQEIKTLVADAAVDEFSTTDQEEVPAVQDDVRGDDELLVVFRLQDEEYCVDVDAVQEIIRVPETLIRVPKTLQFVEGLVNLRGKVLPVVDLRTRLGLERADRDERQRIVVLIINGIRTGFIVDSVAEVLKVSASATEAAPELSAEQARLISRVANLTDRERMLLILDPDELLAPDELERLAGQAGVELAPAA